MKLIHYFILFIFLYINIEAQISLKTESIKSNNYNLTLSNETNYTINKTDSEVIIDFPGYDNEGNAGSFILPVQDIYIAIPPNSNPSVKVNFVEVSEIRGIPRINKIPYKLNDSTLAYKKAESLTEYDSKQWELRGFLWISNYYCAHIRLRTYDFDSKRMKVIKKNTINFELRFDQNIPLSGGNKNNYNGNVPSIIINKESAIAFKGNPFFDSGSNDEWINFNATYIKLGTPEDGIYRISPQDLNNFGVNTQQIIPSSFQLFLKGEEIPIYVSGEEDNIFNGNDYIEFIGKRNMGGKHREVNQPGERFNEYLDVYTDTSVYWLTWGNENGKRVLVENNVLNSSDTLNYYHEIVHLEGNPWFDYGEGNLLSRESPFLINNKTWSWFTAGVGQTSQSFSITDLVPSKNAQIFCKLQGYGSNIQTGSHHVALGINSSPQLYDSTIINRYQQVVLNSSISSDRLVNGNNTFHLHSFSTSGALNTVFVDWFEIEFPRFNTLSNDEIILFFPYLNSNSIRLVKVTNSTGQNYSVWKSDKTNKKFANIINVNNTIIFSDTVSTNDKYFISGENVIKKPIFYYKKQFSDLASVENKAEYLLITHDLFVPKAEEYINFIEQSYELTADLVNVNDIYDQYNFGFKAPEPIRDYLKKAYSVWGEPILKYVFFVGKAN